MHPFLQVEKLKFSRGKAHSLISGIHISNDSVCKIPLCFKPEWTVADAAKEDSPGHTSHHTRYRRNRKLSRTRQLCRTEALLGLG